MISTNKKVNTIIDGQEHSVMVNSVKANLLNNLSNEITSNILSNEATGELLNRYNLSSESFATGFKSNEASDNLEMQLDNILNSSIGLSNESLAIPEHSRRAAINVAKMCTTNVSENILSFHNNSNVGMSLSDGRSSMNLSQESFSGMKVGTTLVYSMNFQIHATQQAEFAETLFPTIVMDPMEAGYKVETDYTAIQYNHIRDGRTNQNLFDKRPVTKLFRSVKNFITNSNSVIPYRTEQNKTNFLDECKSVQTHNSEVITTAPLLFDRQYDLIHISQTPNLAATGQADNTDSLDRAIFLKNLYFGKQDKSEIFVIKARHYNYSTFLAGEQGSPKSLRLDFHIERLRFDADSIAIVKDASITNDDSKPNKTFEDLAGYQILLQVNVDGDINIETAIVELSCRNKGIVRFTGLKTAEGRLLSPDEEAYIKAKALFDSGEIVLLGYDIEATRTNENLRSKGKMITVDWRSWQEKVPLRDPYYMQVPVLNINSGSENDLPYLDRLQTMCNVYINSCALETLLEFDDMLNVTTKGGTITINNEDIDEHSVELNAMSGIYINSYYRHFTESLSNHVDSLNSQDRRADIREYFKNRLHQEVNQMYLESYYCSALELFQVNKSDVKVIIVCDKRVKPFLFGDDTEETVICGFGTKIVTTEQYGLDDIKNKVFVTFGIFDANRNTTVNILNFGQMLWAPMPTVDIQRTAGTVSRTIQQFLRFQHKAQLPLLLRFDINDIDGILGKSYVAHQVYDKNVNSITVNR